MNDEPGQQPDNQHEPAGPATPPAPPAGGDAVAPADAGPGGKVLGGGGGPDEGETGAAAEPEAKPEAEAQGDRPPAAAAGGPEGGGEQIEWRPVDSGGAIAWQPVVSGGTEEPEFDEAAWEAALHAEPAPREPAGNGVTGPATPGVGAHPARGPRRPRRPLPPTPPTAPGEGPATGGAVPNKQKRQVIILSFLTVFVLLVAGVGFMLSRSATKKGNAASPPAAGGPTTTGRATGGTTVPATELTTWKDDPTGVSIRYPKAWKRLLPLSDIRGVLVVGDNDAVNIRIIPIQTVATQDNIGNFKAVTDAIVFGSNQNKLIQEQLVLLNGKLCYYYLYTYTDSATNQQGVHAHYFIFEGLRIVSVVFQSQPAEDFNRQAAVFDQVAESITVDPAPPGATAVTVPPTTVP